jgi:flagellar motor protein MotB
MKSFNNLKIKQKFQVVLSLCFLIIGLFLFFYFPVKEKSELTDSLFEKGKAIAQMVAKTSSASLVFDDASSVTSLLKAFEEMKDVDFAIVLKKDGSKFAVYNEEKYVAQQANVNKLIAQNSNSYSDSESIIDLYPIMANKDNIGTVVISMNLSAIDSAVSSGRLTVLFISIAICFIGLYGMSTFVNKVIFDPVRKLTNIANQVSTGDVDVTVDLKNDDEIGQLEKSFFSIVNSVKDQSHIAELIAAGELSSTAVVRSDKDVLSKSMNKVIETLRNLISEVGSLTKSAAEGRTSERGNIIKYKGGYKEILTGINNTLDAMVEPIREGAEALENYFGNETGVQINPETKIITTPKESFSDQLRKLITDYHYSKSIQLEESERGIIVHILEDVLFAPGRAVLTENSKIVLNRLAGIIKELPNDIRIEGHTDNTPIGTSRYPSNWHLSVDRALNTAYYLINNQGLDPDKVSIVGYAEYRPIALNDSPDSRSKNRRVDLVILK